MRKRIAILAMLGIIQGTVLGAIPLSPTQVYAAEVISTSSLSDILSLSYINDNAIQIRDLSADLTLKMSNSVDPSITYNLVRENIEDEDAGEIIVYQIEAGSEQGNQELLVEDFAPDSDLDVRGIFYDLDGVPAPDTFEFYKDGVLLETHTLASLESLVYGEVVQAPKIVPFPEESTETTYNSPEIGSSEDMGTKTDVDDETTNLDKRKPKVTFKGTKTPTQEGGTLRITMKSSVDAQLRFGSSSTSNYVKKNEFEVYANGTYQYEAITKVGNITSGEIVIDCFKPAEEIHPEVKVTIMNAVKKLPQTGVTPVALILGLGGITAGALTIRGKKRKEK